MLGQISSLTRSFILPIPPNTTSLRPGNFVHAPLVLSEVRQQGEAAATHRAREGLLPPVHPLVPQEFIRPPQNFGTVAALQLGVLVIGLHVAMESCFSDTAESAQSAQFELSDVMGVVFVLDQSNFGPEDRAACRAGLGNEYTFVHLSDVLLKSTIRLESLGALVAMEISLLYMGFGMQHEGLSIVTHLSTFSALLWLFPQGVPLLDPPRNALYIVIAHLRDVKECSTAPAASHEGIGVVVVIVHVPDEVLQ